MANTPKGTALGATLRRARLAKNLTIRQLGALIGRNQGEISRWETGDRPPRPDHVAQILTALGIKGAEYDEIISMAFAPNDSNWVATTLPAQRQQLAAYVEIEATATRIVAVYQAMMPGLLQTDDYIRAIMSAGGLLPDDVAMRNFAIRVERRKVIDRPGLREFTALIGESALYQQIGGRDVLREQIRHLITMSRHPKINLRIVPLATDWHPMLEGIFVVLESEQSAPIVQLENRRSSLLLHEPADVESYEQAVSTVLDLSLSQDDSRKLLARVLDRMESRHDHVAEVPAQPER
jgi:transcriptional regulator with XRE-family HTH domain